MKICLEMEALQRELEFVQSKILPPPVVASAIVERDVRAAVGSSDVIDLQSIYIRMDGSVPRVMRVLRLFGEGCEELLRAPTSTTAEPKVASLRRSAHSLKSLLLEVGAWRYAEIAAEAELSAQQGNHIEACRLMEFLPECLRHAEEVVASLLSRAG